MVHASVIDLVKESGAHGVFAAKQETSRTVYCTVKSVSRTEFYKAHEAGIEPTIIFELSDYSEYEGEKIVVWNGVRYRVIRTYVTDMSIEITCEEATVDA